MLTRRNGNLYTILADNKLSANTSATVMVTVPGGEVVSSSTYQILGQDTTDITLRAGHGFAVGDFFIVGTSTSLYKYVLNVVGNVITHQGSSVAGVGDILLNLGQDSGPTSPNWDGMDDRVTIYSDLGGQQAITSNAVTVEVDGEYHYYHAATTELWEIVRSGSTVLDYQIGSTATHVFASDTATTDNAVARWDGTDGRTLQESVVIVSDAGAVTGISTLTTSSTATIGGAATVGGTLGVTGASTLSGAVTAGGAGTGLAVTNNQTIGGTLGVTGVTTLAGLLNTAAITASGVITANAAIQEKAIGTLTATSGGTFVRGFAEETVTLSTSGATTDSVGDLLPANSFILAVTARIQTTITTATDWSVGDATTAARFSAANATLTAGTTSVGLQHLKGGISTDATGPVQVAAAKVRITTTGTPGAGAIKLCVWYLQWTASTS